MFRILLLASILGALLYFFTWRPSEGPRYVKAKGIFLVQVTKLLVMGALVIGFCALPFVGLIYLWVEMGR